MFRHNGGHQARLVEQCRHLSVLIYGVEALSSPKLAARDGGLCEDKWARSNQLVEGAVKSHTKLHN